MCTCFLPAKTGSKNNGSGAGCVATTNATTQVKEFSEKVVGPHVKDEHFVFPNWRCDWVCGRQDDGIT